MEVIENLKSLIDISDEIQRNIREEGLTMESFRLLNETDLKELGFKMGARKLIMKQLLEINSGAGDGSSTQQPDIRESEETITQPLQEVQRSPATDFPQEKRFDAKAILRRTQRGNQIANTLEDGTYPERNDRILMVKILGDFLLNNCEVDKKPSKPEKIRMVRSIVRDFPVLKSSETPNGWEHFYDPVSHTGFLETFIRSKRSRNPNLPPLQHKRRKQNVAINFGVTAPNEQLAEVEVFLRRTLPTSDNRQDLLQALNQTRTQRRDWITKESPSASAVIKRYPRLMDLREAMAEEFMECSPTYSHFSEVWIGVEERVIELCKKLHPNTEVAEIVTSIEECYNEGTKTLKALSLLPYLLPPPPKKGTKKGLWGASHVFSLMVCQLSGEMSITDATDAAVEMGLKQPGVVLLGSQYFCFLDRHLWPVDVGTVTEAIEFVVMVIYVFNLQFPPELRSVYGLIERLCGMCPSVSGPRIEEIFIQLKQ